MLLSDHSLSVVMPVYNEEELIAASLLHTLAVLEESGVDYELLVVDDSSNDKTAELIEGVIKENGLIKLIKSPANMGYGGAVQFGIPHCTKPYMLTIPADEELSIQKLEAYLSNAKENTIVVGTRSGRKGYNILQQISSNFYSWLIGFLYPLQLEDYNWIHLYPKGLWSHPKFDIKQNRIVFFAEVLLKADALEFSIKEVHVDHSSRKSGNATSAQFKTRIRAAKEFLSFFQEFKQWKKQL